MRKLLALLLGAALIACRQEPAPANTLTERADNSAVAKPASQCEPPMLISVDEAIDEGSAVFRETKANFSAAFASACAKGLLKGKALIDPKAADQDRLFLLNAPESNVASIYLPREGVNRMVLEFYFLTDDGQTHVPPVDELEEAIYCATHDATPEEVESSGRCLVD